MDEVTVLDVLISQAHRRIEVSRGELVSAIDTYAVVNDGRGEQPICLASHVEQAQARHDRNVKRLRELTDKKFPETVGVW